MLDTSHNFYSKIQNTGNYLLVKDDVGKSKPFTRNLPSKDFSYGMRIQKDKEDAGLVISSWASKLKKSRQFPDQDFKKLNILSVAEKQVTATQQRVFRKTVQIRRMSSEEPKINDVNKEIVYGMPLRPSTPIKAVLGHFYGHFAAEQKHIAYSEKPKTVIKRRAWSQFSEKEDKKEEPKTMFKMKKFLTVKARTSTRRNFNLLA